MGIYIEALVLYIILFLTGSLGAVTALPAGDAEFSAVSEIYRIILYYIPSLVLIWILLIKGDKTQKHALLPVKNDLITGFIALPSLLITGLTVSYISVKVSGQSNQVLINMPSLAEDWIILCLTCFFAAYLEESFFRYYLLTKSREMKMGQMQALVFSAALFSICHIYEGQWGVLNAVISSLILGFLFLRYNAFHGIAIAHGLYNIAVYVIYNFF